eukprot:gnl/Spiro4/11415_TR6026_c0_g1_i1.p1 gnl/Spiro4/11415_TR6026_c0_g1~~gnl/Spiro4/11415_TR6026_c0_g1_i1.p1  ORF type:complete len:257 (+),score=57.65 gnl/Spiro4/11415_TR6026_c0_g1_i1:85-771(+)
MVLSETLFGSLNFFRATADMLHVLSFVLLFLKMWRVKNAIGISLKSQQLFVIVFITRYLDVFFSFVSVYNSVMKVLYLISSIATVYVMRTRLWTSYQQEIENDSFNSNYLLLLCGALALIFNHGYNIFALLWVFSIYLEAVAILPQLWMLLKTREVENLTSHYMICLGAYRALYILNWVYRWYTDPMYGPQWIIWISGVVQTVLYGDFAFYYLKSKLHGPDMPVVLSA